MIGLWSYCETKWWTGAWRKRSRGFHLSIARVGLLFLSLFLSACDEQIVHDLSEREANKAISHLNSAKFDAKKVVQADGRWAISVPQESMLSALQYMDTQRVLSARESKSATSSKGSIIPSKEEQWFRYERSVALSIEESLLALPGMLEARVHVTLPDVDPLFGSPMQKKGSGSVLLVVDDRFNANDDDVAALVGGAAGLPREVVRVLRSKTASHSAPEVPREVPVEVPVVASHREAPFSFAVPWIELGALILVGICVYAARKIVIRSKRPVAFAMPKGLDFEE